MNLEAWLLEQTRIAFPHSKGKELNPILRGGSDRSFYRLEGDTDSMIVMHYGQEKRENLYYADIALFLEKLGVPAPKILRHDRDHRVIWMQDLGSTDLYSWRHAIWEQRRDAYHKTLFHIHHLHEHGLTEWQKNPITLMEGFGPELYEWERNYFRKEFVQAVCEIPISPQAWQECEALADRLIHLPPALVHRDFQSHNIMILNETPHLIDFQGMRQGTPYYDLASLLFDPYVEFSDNQRLELLQYYHSLSGQKNHWDQFLLHFHDASVQRLLQAVGCYGLLGYQHNKDFFTKHILPGLHHLILAADKAQQFPALLEFLHDCQKITQTKLSTLASQTAPEHFKETITLN